MLLSWIKCFTPCSFEIIKTILCAVVQITKLLFLYNHLSILGYISKLMLHQITEYTFSLSDDLSLKPFMYSLKLWTIKLNIRKQAILNYDLVPFSLAYFLTILSFHVATTRSFLLQCANEQLLTYSSIVEIGTIKTEL
ncbi:hypothetical protein D9M71_633750 [compost metagenome]